MGGELRLPRRRLVQRHPSQEIQGDAFGSVVCGPPSRVAPTRLECALWVSRLCCTRRQALELDLEAKVLAKQLVAGSKKGCCTPLCCWTKRWFPVGSMAPIISNTRSIKLWYLRPPWGGQARMTVTIPKNVTTSHVLDWLAEFQRKAPSLAS